MDCLYYERALHRRSRAQTRVAAFELLHDEPVRGVTNASAAVLLQIWSVETQCAHPRNEMFRKFPRAMARNDLRQDFLLHKTPCAITGGPFLVRKKLFDVVVIQRGHVVSFRSSARQFSGRQKRRQWLAAIVAVGRQNCGEC